MNTARMAVYAGIACTLPIALWLLIQLRIAGEAGVPARQLAQQCMEVLPLLQSLAVVLCMPWLLRDPLWRSRLSALVLLLLVPLPLVGLCWLAGAAQLAAIARAAAWVAGFALLVCLLILPLVAWLPQRHFRPAAIAVTQLLLMLALWRMRAQVSGWIAV
jgi:hypothetical protein